MERDRVVQEIERVMERMGEDVEGDREWRELVERLEDGSLELEEFLVDVQSWMLERKWYDWVKRFLEEARKGEVSEEFKSFCGELGRRYEREMWRLEMMRTLRRVCDWDKKRWEEIVDGLDGGLDVSRYAKPEYSLAEMRRIKRELEREKMKEGFRKQEERWRRWLGVK